jgi:hypothetical protein
MTSAGGVGYAYDANGSVTSDGTGRTFTLSARDQVIRVVRGGEESRFWYGSSGGRVVHTQYVNGAVSERTHYVGSVEVVHRSGGREFRRSIGGVALATFFEGTQVEQVRYLHRCGCGPRCGGDDPGWRHPEPPERREVREWRSHRGDELCV